MRAIVAALALTALVGAGCSDDDAGPSPTTDATTPTSLADYTGVVLPGVGGETTTTIEEKGTARLVGTVSAQGGLLAGATVRIDRLVKSRPVTSQCRSDTQRHFDGSTAPRRRTRAMSGNLVARREYG